MKECITKVKSMEREHLHLLMEVFIQEIFSKMKFQDGANTSGLMVKLMKAIGKEIKCMVMAY